MMSVGEVLDWLEDKDYHHSLAIDEGGLTLVVVDTGEYLELGGVPEEE